MLIIQNDTGNKFSPTVIAAAVTGREKKNLPTHVPVNICDTEGVAALPKGSIILLEQIRTIDKRRLTNRVGKISEEQMRSVEHAIDVSFCKDWRDSNNETNRKNRSPDFNKQRSDEN